MMTQIYLIVRLNYSSTIYW